MYHVWQIAPAVRCRVPGDCAGANGKVDVAACKQPPAVIRSGGGSRAARRQIGDRGPSVRAWIETPGIARRGIATPRVNIVAQSSGHQAMVSEWIVRSH